MIMMVLKCFLFLQRISILFLILKICDIYTVEAELNYDPPEVNSKLGKIQGIRLYNNGSSVDAYLSVPFAEPPVGNFRFQKSEPVKAWNGTIKADHNPSACHQYTLSPFPWYDGQPDHDEDCLYLNIFVPSIAKKGRAVIYWVFGGGLSVGSTRLPIYNAKALALTGDVIVVTVNYRLGPLGFFYSGTDDAPGNVGIYDMILGLQFVKDNIDAFGGDPNSITIMGESAGSVAVSLLTVSPMTKDLYKRVILMSGAILTSPPGNDEDLQMGQTLAEKVNCASKSVTLKTHPEQVVQCLRGIEAETLVRIIGEMKPYASRTFLPTYGDDIVGNNPEEALKNGLFHKTDILLGNVGNEGSFHIATSHPDIFGFFGHKNTLVNKSYGEELIRKTFSRVSNPDEVVQYYLGDVNDDDEAEIRKQVCIANGDYTLRCPTVYQAEEYAKRNNKVFYYSFAHRPSTTPWASWMGVVHFEDVQFVFGQPVIAPEHYDRNEVDLSIRIMKLWANFAKNGDPGEGWPLFSENEKKLKILSTSTDEIDDKCVLLKNCDFLKKYFDLMK